MIHLVKLACIAFFYYVFYILLLACCLLLQLPGQMPFLPPNRQCRSTLYLFKA